MYVCIHIGICIYNYVPVCVLSSPLISVHHLDTDLEWSSTVGSAMVESS